MNGFRMIFGVGFATVAAEAYGVSTPDTLDQLLRPAFREHCVRCHGENGKVKGKLNLLSLKTEADFLSDPDQLESILFALEDGEMPPEDEPSPSAETRAGMVASLDGLLKKALGAHKSFARAPIRRMNRFQYNNAVKDLFELKVEVYPLPEKMMRDRSGYFRPASGKMPEKVTVSSRPLGKSGLIEPRLAGVVPFPQDLRAEHGYDNRGDHLSLSPFLMEIFLELSHSVVRSPTFNAKTCGIWSSLFAPPPAGTDLTETVRLRLRSFLTKAFRRPVEEEALERYVEHVNRSVAEETPFTEAMKQVASAAIASPRFLYLYERSSENDETTARIDEYELASRLSFFLWGAPPDEDLLKVAETGKLSDPATLEVQVERMLKDARLKRFCDSFPAQWLQLDRILSSIPDVAKYPDFYYAPPNYRTTMDMMMEPLLLFETILIEDRSILEFIDSDYSYRSPRLAKWYGDEVTGKLGGPVTMAFRRVPVTDRRQGGVLTSAAVMTMTSGPSETKPITRGAWVAGVIFNDPPEPPPADVPPLEKASEEELATLTLRERFAAHRERADCAGCHAKLDPLGFALENFDPTGRWRDEYENGLKVDPSGVLFRKREFADVIGFKDAILAEKDRFTRAFAGHLLSFALGRELTAADSPAAEAIARAGIEADYKLRAMIHAVTRSEPFHSKSNPVAKLSLGTSPKKLIQDRP